MPRVHIQAHGSNIKAFRSIDNMIKNTKKGIRTAFDNLVPRYEETVEELMNDTKTGRVYRVYVSRSGRRLKRGRLHRASRKGEAPAILSGRLFRSTRAIVRGGGKFLTFGAGMEYAKYLELGGRSFLLKTINLEERNTKRELCNQIEKAINEG